MSAEPVYPEPTPIGRRPFHKDGMGWEWDIPDYGLTMAVDYISSRSEEMHGEIRVRRGAKHIHMARFNLSSTTSRNTLVKTLDARTVGAGIPWERLVEQFCVGVMEHEREGEQTQYTQTAAKRPISYLINPLVIKGKTNMLFAPGGCIAGETLIEGPDGARRADELCEGGQPVRVWALGANGVVQTWASPVYRKGLADLYEYQFASGRRVIATLAHRFLSETGWRRGDETNVGERLAVSSPAPQHSESSFLSASRAGAQRSWRTPEDSMGHCSTCCRRCGQPLQSVVGTGQSGSPSLACAAGRSQQQSGMDVLEQGRGHIHPCRQSGRPSRSSSSLGGPLLAGRQCPSTSWLYEADYARQHSNLTPEQSQAGYAPARTSHEYGLEAVPSAACQCVFDQHSPPTLYSDTLVSRGYVRTDSYYDLTVPGYENYLANGIWHHNSGKGYLCVEACCAVAARCGIGDLVVGAARPFYFDWEDDFETFEDRLNVVARGMGADVPRIPYRRMRGLASDRINEMARAIADAGADFGLIDSFSAAGGSASERTTWDTIAHRLFDALDMIPNMTWLIIDHVSGDNLKDPAGKAYGSIQKMNRVRNAWEMRSEQEAGGSEVHMRLYDAKWNHTGKRKPLGLCLEFRGDSASFTSEDPVSGGNAGSQIVAMSTRMAVQLSAGPMDTATLARLLKCPDTTVRSELSRNKARFRRDDNGLIHLVREQAPDQADDREEPWV